MNYKYLIIIAVIAVLTILPSLAITQQTFLKTMYPLQTEYVEWKLKAPTNSQIAYLRAECPIRYKVSYDFTASSQVDVTVIGAEKLKQLYRAGNPPSITPKQSLTRGPIKISFEFGAAMPIQAGSTLPVFITVEDKGTGLYPEIPANALSLSWSPPGFTYVQCDKIGSSLSNTETIPLIRKKSPQIRCTFKAPEITEMETFYLKADIRGKYEIDYVQTISIQPITK